MLTKGQTRPAETAFVRPRVSILSTALITLALGILALVPRIVGLADFYTIDEAYHWPVRVRLFSAALREGNWAGTNLTGHPGVTTMWLGSLGRWFGERAGVQPPGYGDGALFLAYLRTPLTVVNSLIVALSYLVLRRLVRHHIAFLAALMWALSPFIIGHSRLLHLDALLTSFGTLSLLLLLAYTETEGSSKGDQKNVQIFGPALLLSGVVMGLALLTKGPSLVFLPIVGLLMLALSPYENWWLRLRWTVTCYLVWLVVALLVLFVGWPAMWVAPGQAIGRVLNEILANGGQPHHSGNYFLGQPVADPGWLFYPAAVLWRTTPFTLTGLLLLPLALRRFVRERRVLLALLAYVLLFGIAMSIGPKKFDRYLLPIWPAAEILGAAGLVAAADGMLALLRRFNARTMQRVVSSGLVALVGLPLLLTNLSYHRYYLGYFNPLLGGGATGQYVMLAGWGEGLEQVGAWISQRPDVGNGPILASIPPALVHFVPQQVSYLNKDSVSQLSSYAVLYSRSEQRNESGVAEDVVRQMPALYTLQMHGIDYASVHQLPRPFAEPVNAVFGTGLHLRGFTQKVESGALTITPSWDIQQDQPGGVFFFVHVIAADGTKVAQLDLPIDDGMFPTWQRGQQFGRPLTLPWPDSLPSGEYRVVLGTYHPADGSRLPLTQGTPLPEQLDGPGTIQLTTIKR